MINIFQINKSGAAAKPIGALIISTTLIAGCTQHTSMFTVQPTHVYFSHATDNQRALDLSKQTSPTISLTEKETNNERLSEIVLRFDNDSAKVRNEDIERLQSFILNFGADEMPTFLITGHTDSNHSDEYNQLLSQRRAISTQQQMNKMGVPINNTVLRGLGESLPAAENTNAAGRQMNRRVTVSIFAKG